MTLDDLDRPKRTLAEKMHAFYGCRGVTRLGLAVSSCPQTTSQPLSPQTKIENRSFCPAIGKDVTAEC